MKRTELVQIVEWAAQPIGEKFGLPLDYVSKDEQVGVDAALTATDQEVQDRLRSQLSGDFWGEEEGERSTNATMKWFVDPMDGSGARVRGLPTAVCIVTKMQVKNGCGFPVLTVIHNPVTCQTWSAATGEGAYYASAFADEVLLDLTPKTNVLPDPIKTTVTLWPGTDFAFSEVRNEVERDQRFDCQDMGSLGFAHATVASGTTHLSACRASAAYETAAASLLMQEVGGVACDLEGKSFFAAGFPITEVRGKQAFAIPKGAIIASNAMVAGAFLDVVQRCTSHTY